MKTIFDMDNPFFSFMGRLADYVILNFLFLLTACPVFTVGTALRAMHEVLPKMARGTEGSLYRSYMQAYIRNFGRTVPVWILLLASGSVLVFDVTIAADALETGLQKIVLPVVGCLLLLWLLVFSWVFVREDFPQGGPLHVLKASLRAAVQNLPRSLLMILIEILPVLCYTFFTQIFLGIVLPFYICIGFSLTGALCSLLAGRTKIGRDGQDIKQKEEPENGQSEESHDQHKRKR